GGTPAEPGFADEQHALIKATLRDAMGAELRVLYGGSVNPGNCVALAAQPHIDGLFIGRSAWDPDGYLGIVVQVGAS
ncbi:MAG: triose-phosphate isomerase, partial [Pseudomonadota bacterium]|nr:triose-phosphate isomerase [Pseudomonadota bacterium]